MAQDQGSSTQTVRRGAIHSGFPFHRPILASYGGQFVRVTAFGDVEGNSPSYLVTDTNGKSSWRSMDQVTIIDPDYLPPSADQLRGFASLTATTGR